MKNGANGINFCCFRIPHINPAMHAITNAMANPVAPNHNPPTTINFISPMPMGVSWRLRFLLIKSNMTPIIMANA